MSVSSLLTFVSTYVQYRRIIFRCSKLEKEKFTAIFASNIATSVRPSAYRQNSHFEIPIVKNVTVSLVLKFTRLEHNL
jgi:hypothetical protein